jgi:hypothetical protein
VRAAGSTCVRRPAHEQGASGGGTYGVSNSDGDVVLTGAALTQVGIQLPTFEPEQACLLHLTSAD